jgi:hypothetical protein
MADSFDQFMGSSSPQVQPVQAQPQEFSQFMTPNQVQSDAVGQVGSGAAMSIPGVVGGLANAAANTAQAIPDGLYWAANKIGAISDEQKQKYIQDQHDFYAPSTSGQPDSPNDVFTQGYNQYPIASKGAEILGDIAGAGKLAPGKGLIKGSGILDSLVRGAINATEGAGISATAGDDNHSQNVTGAVAGAASPVADLAGAGINKLIASKILPAQLTDQLAALSAKIGMSPNISTKQQAVLSEANNTKAILDTADQKYSAIKQIPGTINGNAVQGNVTKILIDNGAKIDTEGNISMLNADKSRFDDGQLKVLQSIQRDAGNLGNMENAVQLRQYINDNTSLFQGKGVDSGVMASYKTLKSNVDNLIDNKASQAGLSSNFKDANKYYHDYVSPLHEEGSVDRMNAVHADAQRSQLVQAQQQATQRIQAVGKQGVQPDPRDVALVKQGTPPATPGISDATKSIFPNNPSPEQVSSVLSRMDPVGSKIMANHFVSQAVGDVVANPEAFNKNGALIKINNIISKYSDVLPKDSRDILNGTKAILKAGGAVAEKSSVNKEMVQGIIGHVLGAGGGAYAGYNSGDDGHGSPGKALLGAAVGLGLEQGGKTLLNSSAGLAILKHIGNNPNLAQKLFQGGINVGASVLSPTPAPVSSN